MMNVCIYRQFVEMKEEILRHKWIESEKKKYDIGFEQALVEWMTNHRSEWAKYKREKTK